MIKIKVQSIRCPACKAEGDSLNLNVKMHTLLLRWMHQCKICSKGDVMKGWFV